MAHGIAPVGTPLAVPLRTRSRFANATVAFATAIEPDFVSLPDALQLVLLLIDDPRRFRRAALRWHARYCAEMQDVGFGEAHAVLSPAGRGGGRSRRSRTR